MAVFLDPIGYKSQWVDFNVNRYEGYQPNMSDYHMHEYYEISLIISGKVKVLLPDAVYDGISSRILLTAPMTAHLVVCEPTMLYKRINILFSYDFIANYVPEWRQLLGVFGKNGRVITIDSKQTERFVGMAEDFDAETDKFRKRLLLMLMLSQMLDISGSDDEVEEPPAFVSEVLLYIQDNFHNRILAADLAWRVGVGRTTLMTAFKKYTGSTLNGYITDCRLKYAISLLYQGATQQAAATASGFGDACNMIRAFRRRFGMTPGKYVAKNAEQ